MSLPVPCPKCGTVLKAPADSAGRKARCRKCQERFRIPGEATGDDPVILNESLMLSSFDFSNDSASQTPPERQSTLYRNRKQGRGGYRLALIVGGLFLILCVVAAGAYAWRVQHDRDVAARAETEKVNQQRKAEERIQKQFDESAKRDRAKGANREPGDTDESPRRKTDLTAIPNEPVPRPSPSARVPARVTTPLAPEPPGENAKPISKPAAVVTIPFEPDAVQQIIVNTSLNRLIVVRNTFAGFQGKGAIRTVDLFSYPAAVKLTAIEISSDLQDAPLALGTGDGLLATESKPGQLTAWRSSNGKKVLTDVVVFPSARFAGLITGEESVLVVSHAGQIKRVSIDGETPKVTTAFEPAKMLGDSFRTSLGRTMTVSDDGKTACFGVGQTVVAASLTSGNARVEWTLPVQGERWVAMDIDVGGNRIAAVVGMTNRTHRLCVGRLGTEKPIVNAIVPTNIGDPVSVVWFGEIVSVRTDQGTHVLYDTEGGGFVGVIRTPSRNMNSFRLPGGERLLSFAGDPVNPKQSRLLDIEFPFDGYFPIRDKAIDTKKPFSLRFGETGIVQ